MAGRMLPMERALVVDRFRIAGRLLGALGRDLKYIPVDRSAGFDADEARDAVDFVTRLLQGLGDEMGDGEMWVAACTCCTTLAVYCERCGNPGPPLDEDSA